MTGAKASLEAGQQVRVGRVCVAGSIKNGVQGGAGSRFGARDVLSPDLRSARQCRGRGKGKTAAAIRSRISWRAIASKPFGGGFASTFSRSNLRLESWVPTRVTISIRSGPHGRHAYQAGRAAARRTFRTPTWEMLTPPAVISRAGDLAEPRSQETDSRAPHCQPTIFRTCRPSTRPPSRH